MLKVECESCKAPYQVDERRVPPAGLKMRCPKCGHTFVVTAAGAQAPKKTIAGMGAEQPQAGAPKASGSLTGAPGEVDLPAIPDAAGLPAPVRRTAAFGAPLPRPVAPLPAPSPPPKGLDFGEIDLPSPAADLPAPRPFGARPAPRGYADLPAPARPPPAPPSAPRAFGSIDADLPSFADNLPMPAQNLPVAKSSGSAFGEIDLPAVANDLPAPANAQDFLPATTNQQGYLPASASQQGYLPASTNQQGYLPAGTNQEGYLPATAPNQKGYLPATAPNQELLPKPHGYLPQTAPNQTAPNQGLLPAVGDFGELDLPRAAPVGMQLPSAPQPSGPPGDPFGELDLPRPDGAQTPSAPAPFRSPGSIPPSLGAGSGRPGPMLGPAVGTNAERRATGGVGFGEVDLGGDAPGTEMPLASAPARPVASGLADAPRTKTELDRRRAPTVVIKRGSALPKVIGGFVVVVVIGGALLQLTSYGAFGHLFIGDKLNASEYVKSAQQGAERARRRMGTDTYAEARAAADELAQSHARLPRARQLASYAALAQFMVELRFGKDAPTNARAGQWLVEIPPTADPKVLPVALAAQAALNGDFAKARKGLDTAAKLAGSDPLQQDIAFTRGEVELLAKEGADAVKAFKKAAELAPTARAHFGLARAYELAGDLDKAKEEVSLALKASPNDAGALTLRATLAWKRDHDEAAAQKDLEMVTEKTAKATASPAEIAQAHAIRGWVHLSKDRPADARMAFDQALKLDGRSVMALVGQGEVLYQDSRFTEALSRFDTAIANDALSVDAIIGDAKTQIKLERLADAKNQLVTARAKYPKDVRVAMWLGKAEEALGNKKAAEEQYLAAIDLTDPMADDAVSAYAALASLLAGEGRAPEAQAKLDQAKQRLPDSAALERAFGEIAAAQGHYEEAIAHYQSTLQRDPTDIGARFRLGVTLRHMRKIDEAGKELDQVYALDKEYPGLALERGLLYEEAGEVQKALEMFKGALDRAPQDPDLQLRVGAAYVAIGRPDDGIPLLQKVLALRPNSAEAQHFIGRAYLQKGGLGQAQAMRYLQKAVDLDPQRPEYHLYVGWAANEATPADLGRARTEIEKALSLDRLLADGYWQLGVVERKQGQVKDAIRHLLKALELRPNRSEAHAELALAHWDLPDPVGSLAEWKKAVEADPSKTFWRFKYGEMLYNRNGFAEAAKHLSFAATNAESESPRPGWLPKCEFEAGEANKKTGKKAEAIERLNQYLSLAPPSDPFRREAEKALQDLGAPYNPNGL